MTHEDYVEGDRYVWRPAPVPEDQYHAAQRILADLDKELAPAQRDWISGRIVTLLAHYWTADMPEKLQAAVAVDWVAILGHLPRHAIERACAEYLAGETRWRPTPGQIRTLAEARIADKRRDRDRLAQCLGEKPAVARGGVKRIGGLTKDAVLAQSEQIRKDLIAGMDRNERKAWKRYRKRPMPARRTET